MKPTLRLLFVTLLGSIVLPPQGELRAAPAADPSKRGARVEHLVPEVADRGFSLEPGPRPYRDRLGFSPAFGRLGRDPYYAVRLSFHPRAWLGWEARLGHNPSESVHALVNGLDVHLRWPLPWRVQPYLSVGYGMMMVFPGRVFEADPVTKNQLAAGAGVEFFLRDDLSLRGEWRGTTVFGSDARTGSGRGYDYAEFTVGLSFYRTVEP